jgi:Xaa-Pro aminopeptidase
MDRIQKIQKELRRRTLSAALISKPENVRYLCGYVGSNGRLLVTPTKAILITDFRYLRAARRQIPKKVGLFDQKKGAELKRLLGKLRLLGVEEGSITHSHYLAYRKLLPKTKLKDVSGLVEELRCIKDESEMKILRQAVSIANRAFEKLAKTIRVGDSEDDLEWRLLRFAHELGADGFSFPPIIAFGKNTADVHHAKEPNRLKEGENVLIDMGIVYQGYMTDMTRVLSARTTEGVKTFSRLREIYDIVLRANQAAIRAIKVGMKASDIDRVARGIIEKAGYGPNFGHALGHGVGLEVHEMPNVSEKSEIVIKPGMVFTIEPGIYLDDFGGVRIEDMVYVDEKGKVEVLTTPSKGIRIVR